MGSRFEDSAPLKRALVSATVNTSSDLLAAVTGKKIRLLAADFSVVSAATLTWRSATTAISGARAFAANGQYILPFNPAGWLETVAGEALNLLSSTSTAVGGMIVYQEVS